ncbi:MAG TPA: Hsp20/alpha crystallin family protein [Mycobacteriales bacterium]|nr:Hsp20/alpha crystallin family protein [Mycobacteriales bacterium]
MAGHEVERRWDWPEWPRWSSLRSLLESTFEGADPIRIEETVQDDQLVVEAELPGIDPDKDVEISVQERTLHIRAKRRQETKEETPGRRDREFRYGSFARRIPLPKGVSEEQVTASYQDGILEVRVPLPREKPAETAKRIQVRRT